MNKFLTYLISLVVLLAINVTWPKFFGAAPDFLFLLVVFYAFRKNDPDFLWLAFFSGLLLDSFSNVAFGTFIFTFLIISLLINYTTRTMLTSDPSAEFIIVVVAVSYLFSIGLMLLYNSLAIKLHFSAVGLSPLNLNIKIWLDLLLNLIFAPLVYALVLLNDKIIIKTSPRKL